MSTLFLINPASGKKRNPAATEQLVHDTYESANKPVETLLIDFANLSETLREAEERGITNIYAVGGDGTVNAIGTRLIDRPISFGVIPKGSGNGYARNLGFSIRTKLAIKQTLNCTSVKVDTGVFNGLPFLNVAGVGLDAEVAKHFSMGKKRGFVPYAKSSAESLFAYQPENYLMYVDGEKRELENIMGIAIANGTQWGYDAKVSPHGSLTDGCLDLIIVHKFPLIKVGLIVGMLFNGKFQNSRYVDIEHARRIVIHRESAGNAQIDGEPMEAGKKIEVEIRDQNLNLLLPNTLTEEKIQSL